MMFKRNFFFRIISLTGLVFFAAGIECKASDLVYGPYEVGFKSYKTYDDSRTYIVGEDTISRPLLIHFWYPSQEKVQGHTLSFKHYIDLIAQREDYAKSGSEVDENSFSYVNAYSGHAKNNLGLDTSINTREILDSPVFGKSGIPIQTIGSEFPLLLYAPSNSKASVQNHVLCEYLASHGFMILSVASAGPNSIKREKFQESTMAQVTDMEHILKYSKDSLQIEYTKLGLFGFSSGGNAITMFQMRNKNVDAVFSMDGGQEYSGYLSLYKMQEFDLDKTNVPYCSLINNYEDFSIYPLYNSVITSEKYLFRLPHLNHNGFVSYWQYFDSCSPDSVKSDVAKSFETLSKCALGFFSKYLKPSPSLKNSPFLSGLDKDYIQAMGENYSSINLLFNALLDNDLDSASVLLEDPGSELFAEETQISILGRMLIDTKIDQAICLYQNNVKYHPNSWKAHYDLGYVYKEKGETLLAKEELLRSKELNPENGDIENLLDELNL